MLKKKDKGGLLNCCGTKLHHATEFWIGVEEGQFLDRLSFAATGGKLWGRGLVGNSTSLIAALIVNGSKSRLLFRVVDRSQSHPASAVMCR